MISEKLSLFENEFEEKLKFYLNTYVKDNETINTAMGYSLLNGGKRIRPFILKECYIACGGKDDGYIPFAVSVEMIHTYSLIHDDLPAMDNDDYRRGRLSCHKKFGEATAILAGDALLTAAFSVAADTECKHISEKNILSAIRVLANFAGANGMICGQMIDLENEGKKADLKTITEMYYKKTGKLLASAAVIGAVLAGNDPECVAAAEEFAMNLGMAFQIVDDILDTEGDSAVLGKLTGSDAANNKSTYLSIRGKEASVADVKKYTDNAKAALLKIPGDTDVLSRLADYLIDRKF